MSIRFNRLLIALMLVTITVMGVAVMKGTFISLFSIENPPSEQSVTGRIRSFDPRFDALIGADARLEIISDGHQWIEGPVWDPLHARLLFTDIPKNQVLAWSQDKGTRVFLERSGYSGREPFPGKEPGANGLALDSQGRLVLAEHGDRRVTRLELNGQRTVLADSYQGRRLNSPNDVVFDSKGNLYFTDPPFGLPKTFTDPTRELAFCGVYRLSPTGQLELLTADIGAPNGIALSPDERTLYLTDVYPGRKLWLAFDLNDDGSLGPERIIHDAKPWMEQRLGDPDGLEVDRNGNLFGAGPGGVYIFSPEGSLLGLIETGAAASNLAWGNDGSALYITATTNVYRIHLATSGVIYH